MIAKQAGNLKLHSKSVDRIKSMLNDEIQLKINVKIRLKLAFCSVLTAGSCLPVVSYDWLARNRGMRTL